MREGMDQISYVQKERQQQPDGSTGSRGSSPTPCHGGHRPQPRERTAAEVKQRKQSLADEFIKVLWPHLKQGRIGSKTVFKMLARELTHKVLEQEKKMKGGSSSREEVRAAEVVARLFAVNGKVQSDEEAKALLKVFRL